MTDNEERRELHDRDDWVPADIDVDRPNAARMYDYFLGGGHSFAADRQLAKEVMKLVPAEHFARMNRDFLRRAITHLVLEAGIRQFLDLGSGIPTVGNVHEIAQSLEPDCRVVYVDNDPVAVAHGELLLQANQHAVVISADLRDPDTVLTHPEVLKLIDFQAPVGLLMCAVLHFVPDEDRPAEIVATYGAALTPGSHLVISHATDDDYPEDLAKAVALYKSTSTPATLRSRAQITELFKGCTLLEPGVVFAPLWRPDSHHNGNDPRWSLCYGGVAVL